MQSKLRKKVHRLDNLEAAWRAIRNNARNSKSEEVKAEIAEFADEASHRLRSLQKRLGKGTFVFLPAKGVAIPKVDALGHKTGKIRPIVLAPVETRIVQRAILNVLVEIPEIKAFVDSPFSFGGIRKPKLRSAEDQNRPFAVAAAIEAVLQKIGDGAHYRACADIKSFFTRISKQHVTKIISQKINDANMTKLLTEAIDVELHNMAELRERATDFPIEDIGVAQGSSLSPLLGNIVLSAFDKEMNEGDCTCIRYVDDFIILAPSLKAGNARLRKAKSILADLGMELSPEKSSNGALPIVKGFEFLGIEFVPGLIRPAAKARKKLLSSIRDQIKNTKKALIAARNNVPLPRNLSFIATLKRVDGIIDGWGKHYWFCNDANLFKQVDYEVMNVLSDFFGSYRDARRRVLETDRLSLLGVSELSKIERSPFNYPKSLGCAN